MSLWLDQVRELNKADNKTVEQRVLKVMEEVGELAEAVLSSRGAAGCAYKGKSDMDVAEECADAINCILSTLAHVCPDISSAEFDILFQLKLNKWKANIEREGVK